MAPSILAPMLSNSCLPEVDQMALRRSGCSRLGLRSSTKTGELN
jgi:hypothetical protein